MPGGLLSDSRYVVDVMIYVCDARWPRVWWIYLVIVGHPSDQNLYSVYNCWRKPRSRAVFGEAQPSVIATVQPYESLTRIAEVKLDLAQEQTLCTYSHTTSQQCAGKRSSMSARRARGNRDRSTS